MKTILLTTLAACLFTVGLTESADARHGYPTVVFVSGRTSCGKPIYTEKRFCGYDRCGRPVWSYRVLCPDEYRGHGYHYRPGYGRGGYDRGGYDRGAGCVPYGPRYGSGVTIYGNIRL